MSSPTKRQSDASGYPTNVRFEICFGKRLRQLYGSTADVPASEELAAILKRLECEESSKVEEIESSEQKGRDNG